MASPIVGAVSPSESASLHGQKAKTPIIAGAVSGACIGVAWLIGFAIYFYKRHRREKRARALGFKSHREMLDPPKKTEAFIIPPDPAIIEGGRAPGEKIFDDPQLKNGVKQSKTVPIANTEMEKGEEDRHEAPGITHMASAPSRIQDPESITSDHSTDSDMLPSPAPSEMVVPKAVSH